VSFNDIEKMADLSDHRFLTKVSATNNKISKIEGVKNNMCLKVNS
jgi:hypothetical protein